MRARCGDEEKAAGKPPIERLKSATRFLTGDGEESEPKTPSGTPQR